jgi:hypothetical protein
VLAVPRFYFDVRDDARFTADEEGMEFPDLNGAEREAAETATSIGRDLLPRGDARNVTVEVRNAHGQRVLTVTVTMQVKRVAPPAVMPFPRA